jgi:hypothetical protein
MTDHASTRRIIYNDTNAAIAP